jgi:hypothetical protein
MSTISLYAELLKYIGQVTVFVTLPSQQNDFTRLEISSDRRLLSILHDDQSASIQLPCEVARNAVPVLPKIKSSHITLRLLIVTTSVPPSDEQATSNPNPWMASSFHPYSLIACKSCKTVVVRNSLSTWKDLPSKHWAEMMDFWHCHKPDNGSKSFPSSRNGYSSMEKLRVRPGLGFVDTCDLILSRHDYIGSEVSSGRFFCPSITTCCFWVSRRRNVPAVLLVSDIITDTNARDRRNSYTSTCKHLPSSS